MRQSIPPITKNLIIINVLFYFATIVFSVKGINLDVFLAAYYPESPNFKPWQVLTHMFMHASFPEITHILFNMFALWMFGSVVEKTFGPKKFLILYFLAGFGGFILFNLVNYFQIQDLKDTIQNQGIPFSEIYEYSKLNIQGALYNVPENFRTTQEAINLINDFRTPMVGASGAIYGLLLAFAVLYPDEKLMLIFFPVPIKAKYFIPIMVLIEFYMGYKNIGNVAHFAHLGGGLIGFLLARSWKKNLYRWN
ncbi:rhomboid family intramembrane serine protease [Empedobacter sedimenti]|uniref:rhomboid family intramembrane serine protease n=1 Tax=Empedobacter sedimenti TaxID=3042610 RepID=UPI0024A78928|nr:rhomboid family intramembrane serine protease [Empedobacter sedimenti]